MASFEQRIIETLISDLEKIKSLDTPKVLRKECSILLKRIEDAKKLFAGKDDLTSKLLEIETKAQKLKG